MAKKPRSRWEAQQKLEKVEKKRKDLKLFLKATKPRRRRGFF